MGCPLRVASTSGATTLGPFFFLRLFCVLEDGSGYYHISHTVVTHWNKTYQLLFNSQFFFILVVAGGLSG